MKELIEKLKINRDLSDEEMIRLLTMPTGTDESLFPNTPEAGAHPVKRLPLNLQFTDDEELLFGTADEVRRAEYGTAVYVRGLIEFTNFCKNNCYYCGIRRDDAGLTRYRLSKEDILKCAEEGYGLGYRTFVLQGGEDLYYTDQRICDIVLSLHQKYPDCAITLSIGEKSRESYEKYFKAGAERYLLRHETASEEHYRILHPAELSLSHRKQCLFDLKDIGYQVGSGFMVGTLKQTPECILSDLRFLQELAPDMIGIGPYLTHHATPFKNCCNGSLAMTLRLISILRLMFPYALIPATTALGTIHPKGREYGLSAGANVVMPNLSPTKFRKLYSLYENKICTGELSKACADCIAARAASGGYHIVTDRGDVMGH
ncbi:MAG: [FeFe] hydrogenase H-cluster radical SAM maturase HydE [Lachnospiraceae bacterium]|uniref:[FeFe] hydrogenase H-cluster radical SAM maturase HydE n=1 Tax=Candidatus Weimeria bifida TaxID=2599074 RepID=A0A6N7J2C6_9FIRM|nr:[FeFe] hydrogenase H-cluster radical SAM maturase HydE [Candidatus Weimeria bifida]RRF96584.1 MAG: [FeFe] hydrogenase H-cluster radical SAM maturase HydE [Lachnospiraceae bacterium]